jgi:hypothetical protein
VRLADLAWGLLAVAFLVGYFMLLFRVALDVFRRADLGRWGRSAWFVAALLVPLAGLAAYVLVSWRSPGPPGPPGDRG